MIPAKDRVDGRLEREKSYRNKSWKHVDVAAKKIRNKHNDA